MFVHLVFFWCKEGTPDSVKQAMIRYCREEMAKLPMVKSVSAGVPVPSAREVVDGSYDVGISVSFADKAGHDAYQPSEIHQGFVKQFKEHWAKIRVYDFQ
jgi:hypothetical protein